jgi:hypothetical protein
MDGLKEIFEENDIPVVITGYPAMFSFSLNIDEVTCQRDWAKVTTTCISNLPKKPSKKVSCPTTMRASRGSCVTNIPMRILMRR